MNDLLNSLAQAVVVAGFFLTAFGYIVLKPLNTAIAELRQMIAEIRKEIKLSDEDRHQIDIRLTKTEDSVKSAHKRLDVLEKNAIKMPGGDVYIKT